MQFETLNRQKYGRTNFDCGVAALNTYIQKIANQDQKRSLTKIYVLASEKNIIGYYSISVHSVMRDELPVSIKLS